MEEKRDIESRADLEVLLRKFYTRVFADDLIGRFFTEVVPLDLDAHIGVISDFWEAIVFSRHTYRKNVMEVHQHIHRLSAIRQHHLDRWLQLFTATVVESHEGPRATLMQQRALSIATLMNMKLNHQPINKLP